MLNDSTLKAIRNLFAWAERDEWAQRLEMLREAHYECLSDFEDIYGVPPARLDDIDLESVQLFIFEDFLTTRFGDEGVNIIDDFLKRRGWREVYSARRFLEALRDSSLVCYEVVDVVPGQSISVRDLVRGGETVTVEEKTVSREAEIDDCLAARIIRVEGTLQFTPATLVFSQEAPVAIVSWFRGAVAQVTERLDDNGGKGDHTPTAETVHDVVLRLLPVAIMFSHICITRAVLEAMAAEAVESSEADDEVAALILVCFPVVGDRDRVIALLDADGAFEPDGDAGWNWVSIPATGWSRQDPSNMSETTVEDVAIGYVALYDETLVMAVESEEDARQGLGVLTSLLGDLAGRGSIMHDDLKAVIAKQDHPAPPEELLLGADEVERLAQVCLDEHYRHALDDPNSLPGRGSPRDVAAGDGRCDVIEWLRNVENIEARRASRHGQRPYDAAWLWRELGIESPR